MQGFKSFPDKTRLDFTKGITAVVGPNGSGKSNISDAMRWVMGEQSSKALRGEKMAGVIFHGCQTRKESPFAQVTLTIDNTDRALSIDNDLVAVSRKLYKNGDSEYMINGQSVRLKEVNELFMDTGLGKDGYSIIGQGKIADIVSGKGGDRREIFEEAAGIAKFRYKKHEAEKKLADAEDNITRINDILSEHEQRLPGLEKQCEKAKKFRVLDDEKRELEISVWLYRLEQYLKTQNEYEEKIKLLKAQHATLSKELEKAEAEIAKNLQLSAEQLALSDDYKQQVHDAELAARSALADIAVCENDIAHIRENIRQIEDRIEQSKNDKYFLESELESRKNELKALEEQRTEGDKKVTEKEQEFDRLMTDAEESDKAVNKANADISEAYITKSNLSFQIESAKRTAADAGEQLSDIAESKKNAEQNKRLALKDSERLKKESAKNAEDTDTNRNKLDGLGKLLEGRQKKLNDVNARFRAAEGELNSIGGRLQILQDLERSMEGFGASVKSVMAAAKQGRLQGVLGTVAQLTEVEPKYSLAIETALGGALQNIIVENEEAAKRGIRLLKENGRGRATFLPITSVKGTRLDSRDTENDEGFVAVASDIVKAESRFEGIIKYLLGRICIAEDIDAATNIAKRRGYKFRIVTLDGQVINAGGSFTGGSVSKSTGILTRKNEINDLSAQKTRLESEQAELMGSREKLTNEVNKFSADIEGVKETLSNLGSEQVRLEMETKRIAEFLSRYEKSLADSEETEAKLNEKISQAAEEQSKAEKDLADLEKNISQMEEQLVSTVSKQSGFKEKRQALSDELSSLRVKNAERLKDIEACKESIAQLENSINSSSGDSDKLKLEIAAENEKIRLKEEEIGKIKADNANADDAIKELNAKAEEARSLYISYEDEAGKIRSEQRIKLDEKENLSTQMTRGEERLSAVVNDFDALAKKLWDEYELTRSTAAQIAKEPEDLNAAEKRLNELKNKIRALGSVNLGAIEEYAELKEKFDFLTGQLNDVLVSKKELSELIESLTENMKNVFMQNFEAINRNFKSIFAELFGGGKGELTLTDPDNVLECGIDVTVQPPGKVITSIMSLSGGEQSLAAIAIYFAILKNSPSPFCLLDEIEAALDDVNVTRYAQYLHKLTDKTQFITITHRRGTMEEADVLYGVTMQEKGISKLLKMDPGQTTLIDTGE